MLTTAWEDAAYVGDDSRRGRERCEAVRFLTDRAGPHAESRANWCMVASVRRDRLRTRVLMALTVGAENRLVRAA